MENKVVLFFVLCLGLAIKSSAALKVLVVQAHPDDETAFAGSIYKITHDLLGTVDVAVITDGQGGYDLSYFADTIYHLDLTNETVGREYLPKIRKQEMLASADILGVRNVFFLEEVDVKYTLNVTLVLDKWWDVGLVKEQLRRIMRRHHYDFVFCMLPVPGTHGEHKAASILALEVIKELNPAERPIIVGWSNPTNYSTLDGFPITSAPKDWDFVFNRTTPIYFNRKNGDFLNYLIPVNLAIASHKSQGELLMELTQAPQAMEYYWFFDLNAEDDFGTAKQLFHQMEVTRYKKFVPCPNTPTR